MLAHAHLACPSCGARIPAEDMNLSAMAARCRACHAFVDLHAVLPAAQSATTAGAEALPVPLPPQFQVQERGRDVTIIHRWFTWAYPVLGVFCAVWMGFLLFWYAIALQPGTPLMMKLIPLVHVAVGVGLCYVTVAGFVNRTTISIDRDHVSVRHGPLPWPGNLDVPGTALEQLFCTAKSVGQQRVQTIYHVDAVLKDGRQLRLIRGLGAREQALFIEQAIEKHLGIADRRVRSEMRR
ncbi:MAG TPA: hypothetical protein VHG93_12135 [Longimicrobium sp.]|nr:hypothetical protein [Longimicrobium sp.]